MAILLSNAFKLNEVVKHVHFMNPPGVKGNGGAVASGFFITGAKFRSLSPDMQAMLMQLRGEYTERYGKSLMELEATIMEDWKKRNRIVFHNSSPDDEKFILERGNAANELLFKRQEAAGAKNVRAVWSYFQESRKKHEAKR
jgi:TRAP-type C4-dicarboxylate transport system substrate-binding protein